MVTLGRNTMVMDTAVLIGDVQIEDGVAIFDHVVIRGGPGHHKGWEELEHPGQCGHTCGRALSHDHRSDGLCGGHNAIVHGSNVGDEVIVGMGAILLNGSKIGSGSVVAAGAVVTEGGFEAPENSLVAGVPATVKRVDGKFREYARRNAQTYMALRDRYISGSIQRVRGGLDLR